MQPDDLLDVLVIGGGPAGAAAGRLLAAWGHSVRILARRGDSARAMAESIPPSARKLLAAVGLLDEVERAGFWRSSGNTVWWAAQPKRVEHFDPDGAPLGLQVFRPDLDRLLLDSAERAGAQVIRGAIARTPRLEAEDGARVDYDLDGVRVRARARLVLDCSGRSGLVARQGFRRYEPDRRMQAIIGVWTSSSGWDVGDPTHTLVESYADGWTWSVPLSRSIRHVGVMVDGAASHLAKAPRIADVLLNELGKTREMARLTRGAVLDRVWACDASVYSASGFTGPRCLLVGDAGSFIDPLSSFGVKKALSSAWLAAIAAHTALIDRGRRAIAMTFFERREAEVFAASLRGTQALARGAHGAHAESFWSAKSEASVPDHAPDEMAQLRTPAVADALTQIRGADVLRLMPGPSVQRAPQPIVRGREIVLEDALAIPGSPAVRYLAGVDLVTLADLAAHHRQVPELHASYCRQHAGASLPNVLGGLAFLVAHGALALRA